MNKASGRKYTLLAEEISTYHSEMESELAQENPIHLGKHLFREGLIFIPLSDVPPDFKETMPQRYPCKAIVGRNYGGIS